jgi:hypothetical protein
MLLAERLRLVLAIALVLGALLLLAHAAAAQGMEPPVIVGAYTRARAEQDLEAAVGQFADDAVLQLDRGRARSFAGRDEIRGYLENVNGEPSILLVAPRHLADDTVTWSERVLDKRSGTLEMTGEAVIQNGKIASLIYRTGRLTIAEGQTSALAGTPLLPSSMMIGGVALFGMGLLSLSTVRSQRASGSRLNGRLLAALGHWSAASHTLR